MLTNKQIRELLRNNYGDMAKFARFIGISRQGLEEKLKSEEMRNNLYGAYQKFLINEKENNV
jgi:DNA-binding NtrC family response regulator